MLAFTIKRLGLAVLVALAVSALAFLALRASGDVAIALAGEGARAEDIENIRRVYGLDRPLLVQYLDWLGHMLRGDFGQSLYFKTDVLGLVLAKLPTTALLARALARLRAGDLGAARRPRGGLPEQLDRPAVPRARGGRAGDAELLLRADPDHGAGGLAPPAAGLRQRDLGAFRHADDRARLLRRAAVHAAGARRHDRGARLRLHPHGARQGPVRRQHHRASMRCATRWCRWWRSPPCSSASCSAARW